MPGSPPEMYLSEVEHKLPPTEQAGPHDGLEKMSIGDLLVAMHETSQSAFQSVSNCLPAIEKFVEALVPRMKNGGRLFYIGAGTSGRLGVLDASECPPTFGVGADVVQGWIAGGDGALRVAVEGAEDNFLGAEFDLRQVQPSELDTIVGIAASGRTPYVIGGLQWAQRAGLLTACITCNPGTAMEDHADHAIVAVTGPEFITGSTRLNAGTATKLILNLISTTAMVQLGHVIGSRMVDMRPTNEKLRERGCRMIVEATGLTIAEAERLLAAHGSVREAIESQKNA